MPPTWAEHLATLEKKKDNPLPKKGVAGRIRSKKPPASSAPPTPNTTQNSGSGARGRRRRGRSAQAPDISMLLGPAPMPTLKAAGDRELSLIASIQAVRERARVLDASTNGRRKLKSNQSHQEVFRARNADPFILTAIYEEGGHVMGPQQPRHHRAARRRRQGADRPGGRPAGGGGPLEGGPHCASGGRLGKGKRAKCTRPKCTRVTSALSLTSSRA